MPDVRVRVNDQTYALTCDDGEQDQVEKLARYFDDHVQKLAQNLGRIGESRLFMLAALNICDELFTAREQLSRGQSAAPLTADPREDQAIADLLNDAAARIDDCVDALTAPPPKSPKS